MVREINAKDILSASENACRLALVSVSHLPDDDSKISGLLNAVCIVADKSGFPPELVLMAMAQVVIARSGGLRGLAKMNDGSVKGVGLD